MRISKIVIALMIMPSAFVSESKPGEIYTLTGREKSIDEIVKADMGKYPDLYKGESYKFYVLRFKRENNIGTRKLAIGDVFVFPETKASIEAKSTAKRQLLIGKWQINENPESKSPRIKSIEVVTVIEFQDNGEYHSEEEWITDLVGEEGQKKRTVNKHGNWIMEGDLIKIKYRSQKTKDEVEYTITLLTEDELQIGGDIKKYSKIN